MGEHSADSELGVHETQAHAERAGATEESLLSGAALWKELHGEMVLDLQSAEQRGAGGKPFLGRTLSHILGTPQTNHPCVVSADVP